MRGSERSCHFSFLIKIYLNHCGCYVVASLVKQDLMWSFSNNKCKFEKIDFPSSETFRTHINILLLMSACSKCTHSPKFAIDTYEFLAQARIDLNCLILCICRKYELYVSFKQKHCEPLHHARLRSLKF